MRFRGIDYNIKTTIERGVWLWEVHTPTVREGRVKGTRDQAIAQAKLAIWTWCHSNPTLCEPPSTDEELLYEHSIGRELA